MSFTLATAKVVIKGDKGKFSNTIKGAKLETAGFARSATKNLKKVSLGLGLIAAAAGVAAVAIGVKLTKAVIRAGAASIKTAVRYDKLKIGLAAVAGGSKEAEKQLIRLEKVAKLPGLSFVGAIAGSTALQAAGLNAQLAERSLLAFGNALVTVGKGAADLQGVNLALSQIVTKGTGFGQELRQLSERLPQVRQAMKAAFGIGSVEDFKKLGLSAEQFIEGIVKEFEKLSKVSGTVANSLENLAISFDRLKDEVGKTMLSITQDTADALTSIIDRIRIIIPVWRIYQSEVVTVFQEVAKIVLKTTAVMLKGIIAIVSAAAPLVFKPLKDEVKKFQQGVITGFKLITNDVKRFLGLISEEQALEGFNKALASMPTSAERAAQSMAELDRIIAHFLDVTFAELPKLGTEFRDSLGQIDTILKGLTDPIENARAAFAFLREEFDKFGILLGLIKVPEEMGLVEKLLKTLPGVVKINIEQLQRLDKALVKPFNDALDAMQVARNNLSGFFDDLAETALRRTEDMVNTIAPAFENLFTDFFEGNTKNLWEAFFNDLKRIAIQQLAGIFATQLLTGLLTGGASFGATGLAAGLSALAPQSIDPTSRRVGGAVAAGARAIGGVLEGGTVNIFGQDLVNQDTQTITKQVVQGIGPALRAAAADGI